MLPRLPGAINVLIAEEVHKDTTLEKLDRVIAIDVGCRGCVVGRKTEVVRKLDAFGRDIDHRTGRHGIRRERELFSVRTAAIVGGTDPVDGQVRNIVERDQLDCLRQTAWQRTVNNSGDH